MRIVATEFMGWRERRQSSPTAAGTRCCQRIQRPMIRRVRNRDERRRFVCSDSFGVAAVGKSRWEWLSVMVGVLDKPLGACGMRSLCGI